ncbi:type II toxin-antitoxin system ParD family antitoxin [Membranicola marinus]|uniref:Type II toxin-antitoxin system ParD family antitoxin n=1 Tax=Membranihabitans marinus TaxID=1227546 RepID=A0A953L6W5_9BACT|nr:type II toxin-antitoxin system ParD family antitoxin [Membranihabitans marinus]MBY5958092.1 type II toxin-antitoxin system ParD family antitoxin [Membranihabitans marinus]
METKKTISLDKHFEEFITKSINNGSYNSADEVIQAGLGLLEEEENKRIALSNALKEGEDSGFILDFKPEVLLDELHKKHGIKIHH